MPHARANAHEHNNANEESRSRAFVVRWPRTCDSVRVRDRSAYRPVPRHVRVDADAPNAMYVCTVHVIKVAVINNGDPNHGMALINVGDPHDVVFGLDVMYRTFG